MGRESLKHSYTHIWHFNIFSIFSKGNEMIWFCTLHAKCIFCIFSYSKGINSLKKISKSFFFENLLYRVVTACSLYAFFRALYFIQKMWKCRSLKNWAQWEFTNQGLAARSLCYIQVELQANIYQVCIFIYKHSKVWLRNLYVFTSKVDFFLK